MIRKKKVVVGMSGGVDSSVAAALLSKDGFEVIGVTMTFGKGALSAFKKDPRSRLSHIEDARKVAETLGIRHYVIDFSKIFSRSVLKKFIGEYLRAKTPNPCVDCNKFIKFGALYNKALSLRAEYLATGHYARIVFNKKLNGIFIAPPKDLAKDQTYFLCAVDKKVLKNVIFPLGELCKDEVRAIASTLGLKVAGKPASQDICFLSGGPGYSEFIASKAPKSVKTGYFVDQNNRKISKHKGIVFYTIGQRAGIPGEKQAFYCLRIDFKNSNIVVGPKTEVCSEGFISGNANFFNDWHKEELLELMVKIRYNQLPVFAKVKRTGPNSLEAKFRSKQFAVTPGQAAAFYDKNGLLLAGSTIRKSF